eukprot:10854614-Karenia_brevis.AAC.1
MLAWAAAQRGSQIRISFDAGRRALTPEPSSRVHMHNLSLIQNLPFSAPHPLLTCSSHIHP